QLLLTQPSKEPAMLSKQTFVPFLCLIFSILACQGFQQPFPPATTTSPATPIPASDDTTPTPISPASSAQPDDTNPFTDARIAYIGQDRNIYIINSLTQERTAVTTNATPGNTDTNSQYYRYPTWSPNGDHLAYIGFRQNDLFQNSTIYITDANGLNSQSLYENNDNFPFYLYWSPNSQQLSFLAPHSPFSNEINLHLATIATGQTDLLDVGQPYYWHWSPTDGPIITHTGGRDGQIAFLNPQTDDAPQPLTIPPALFQAPAWSPDGSQILLAQQVDDRIDLLLTDNNGTPLTTLTNLADGALAFGWSPNGNHIAYTHTPNQDNTAIGNLYLINPLTPDPQQLTIDPVISFFWSPDGQKLAYFTLTDSIFGFERQVETVPLKESLTSKPNQQHDIYLQLNIYDVATQNTQQLISFDPTTEYLNLLPYFDQYQHSLRLWSPDSRNFLISGYNDDDPMLWIVPANGFTPPYALANGTIGAWSWQ
ncbi:MAG TPA: hypothetical protein VLL52_04355, partial [Anaerolineae bacterium]|nr:hypothetical protein [Anaerolineae bacterium]